jgi:hypothetical protein
MTVEVVEELVAMKVVEVVLVEGVMKIPTNDCMSRSPLDRIDGHCFGVIPQIILNRILNPKHCHRCHGLVIVTVTAVNYV